MGNDPISFEEGADPAITRLAAQWLARRERGLSDSEQAALQAWLAADPRNAATITRLDPQSSELDWPVYSGTANRVLAGLETRAQQRGRRRRRIAVLTMSSAALALLVFFTLRTPTIIEPPRSVVVHEPAQRTLPDGSVIQLKDNADVRVLYSATERRVELVRGTAHFDVRKDAARPFLVTTGSYTARALGTAFVVSVEAGQVALLVTHGRVAMDHETRVPPQASSPAAQSVRATLAEVGAGESVSISTTDAAAPRLAPLSRAEWDDRISWRTPRLDLNATPLREVIAIVNRHNREQLVIADAALERVRLSGALRADRIDVLLELLEADFPITVERRDATIHLRRAAR